MHSGSYEVNKRSNTAQNNDQSYRNCVITMVLFVTMCIIIILATWPWKEPNFNAYEPEKVDSEYSAHFKTDNESKFERLQENLSTTVSSEETSSLGDFETSPVSNDNIELLEINLSPFETTTVSNNSKLSTPSLEILESSSPFDITETSSGPTEYFTESSPSSDLASKESSAFTSTSSESSFMKLNEAFTSETTEIPYDTTIVSNDSKLSTASLEILESSSPFDITETSGPTEYFTESSPSSDLASKESPDFTSTSSESSFIKLNEALTSETTEIPYDTTTVSNDSGLSSSSLETETSSPFGNAGTSSGSTENFSESSSTVSAISEESSDFTQTSSINSNEVSTISTENPIETTTSPLEKYSFQTRLTVTYLETDFTNDVDTKSTPTWTETVNTRPSTFSTPTSNPISSTHKNNLEIENQLALERTTPEPDESPVCMSGQCKQLSSKILSYMNHSANPCDDFYEYACGGMESDPEINHVDLSTRVLKKIRNSMKKSAHLEHSTFKKYINSCLSFEEYSDKSQRIIQAKEILKDVGTFYTESDWPENFDLTQLIAKMILHNNPILFDIVPDISQFNKQEFILSLRPLDNLSKYLNQEQCIEDVDDLPEIDLDDVYYDYKSCKNNISGLNNSVTRALKEFNIFGKFNNSENVTEYINEISFDIHHQIIKSLISNHPPENEIIEAYKSKNYEVTSIGDLQSQFKSINWTLLMSTITGMTLRPDDKIQIYFRDNIFHVLNNLEQFINDKHLRELNNALLGLYARNLYTELVEIKSKDVEENCFINAMKYLPEETSSLYISSFSENELEHINSTVKKILTELKVTMKENFENSDWATEEDRKQLIKKLEGLKVSIPDIDYFNNNSQLNMTDDYFINTIELMKNFRREMYNILQLNPSNPKKLWTYFAKPYQSTAQTLYSLNLILIPLGAIDWPLIQKYHDTFDYLILSNIGNLLAREIANCFDSNGIKYWNEPHNSPVLITDDFTEIAYAKYINCHNQSLFQGPIRMILPSYNQYILFVMPQLTLNSHLSDAMGIKLAHDTLARVGSTSAKLLPWLNLNIDQLFHLTYAQTYCTKISLTNFLTSLYENTILPSRIKIYAATKINPAFGKLWNCPEGSEVISTSSCRIFPNLEGQDTEIISL